MIVMATGLGKSFCFAQIIKRYLPQGRAMVIADRNELLEQARNEIEPIVGFRPDLEKAEHVAQQGFFKSPVVVSSIQTQNSGRNGDKRWHKFDPHEFALLVVDEADLAAADSYRAMIAHYRQNPRLKLLGVTATPLRHDGRPLDDLFETQAIAYPIQDAIAEGWLAPVRQQYLQIPLDLNDVSYSLGDLNSGELRDALARGDTLERLASDTIQYATDRRTVLFADSIENAERITVNLNRHRMKSARIVTGATPKDERDELIAAYRAGVFQYLVNVGVCTRGFNVPEIRCIVFARPTCSITLQTQMLGRGTRTWPGCIDGLNTIDKRKAAIAASPKPDLLCLDLIANYRRKKLPSVAAVVGGNYDDDVIERAEKEMHESDKPCDVAEILEEVQRRHNEELQAEARRKEALQLKTKSKSKNVDPFQLFGITRRVWNRQEGEKPIEPWQREKLERWRMPVPETAAEVQALIAEVRSRTRRGVCTYRMGLQLKRHGYDPNMSFEAAHKIMDELSKNWGPR
jgi:superfamily II DNA or RNA helicase